MIRSTELLPLLQFDESPPGNFFSLKEVASPLHLDLFPRHIAELDHGVGTGGLQRGDHGGLMGQVILQLRDLAERVRRSIRWVVWFCSVARCAG
jgi:hypothetical protein